MVYYENCVETPGVGGYSNQCLENKHEDCDPFECVCNCSCHKEVF
jgi:hypothetical protein